MPHRFPEIRLHILTWWELTTTDWRHDPFALPFWRLYWNYDPGAEAIYDSHIWALSPERALLIAPETVFHTRCHNPVRHVFAHFTVAGLPWMPQRGIHVVEIDALRRGILDSALAARQAGDTHTMQWTAQAWISACLAGWPQSLRHHRSVGDGIDRACTYLQRHLDRQVGNEELAILLDMNVNAFIRAFKRSCGETPQHWHHRQRIEAACIDLATGSEPIEIIAERYGYCDRHHFSRVFKRIRGLPPAEYRVSAQRSC